MNRKDYTKTEIGTILEGNTMIFCNGLLNRFNNLNLDGGDFGSNRFSTWLSQVKVQLLFVQV